MRAIGLDIGTTKICAALIDGISGDTVGVISAPNDAALFGRPFENLQDAEKIYSICLNLLRQLAERHGKPDSIGVTGQMHGLLYTGKNGKALSPLYTWQDARALQNTLSGGSYCDEIKSVSGENIPAGYGAATHYYNIKNDLVPKDAKYFTTIHSYVAMRLAGRAEPVLHCSDCAALGLYDIEKRRWKYSAAKLLGINPKMFPRAADANEVIGENNGIPVSVAIGDNQAGFFGSISGENAVLVNIGTGSQVSVRRRNIAGVPEGSEVCPLNGSESIIAACPLCGGSAFGVLKNFFEKSLRLFGCEPPENIYEILSSAAENANGGLVCDTRFKGTRSDGSVRGGIYGIDSYNFTPGNLAYAFLHGIAHELYTYYKSWGIKAEKIVGSGNAIRKNPTLRKIIEKMFSLKLNVPKHTEEAAYGAALFSLVSARQIKDMESASKLIRYLN